MLLDPLPDIACQQRALLEWRICQITATFQKVWGTHPHIRTLNAVILAREMYETLSARPACRLGYYGPNLKSECAKFELKFGW